MHGSPPHTLCRLYQTCLWCEKMIFGSGLVLWKPRRWFEEVAINYVPHGESGRVTNKKNLQYIKIPAHTQASGRWKDYSFQELSRLQQSSHSKNHSYIVAITPGVYSDGLAQFTDLGGEPLVRIWTGWFNCTTLSVKSVSDNRKIIMYS